MGGWRWTRRCTDDDRLDSTICEVHGHHKGGAAYGYTRQLGYHPLLATRADTGEVLHARQRTGRAASGRGALHLPRDWPWARQFLAALARLQAVPLRT